MIEHFATEQGATVEFAIDVDERGGVSPSSDVGQRHQLVVLLVECPGDAFHPLGYRCQRTIERARHELLTFTRIGGELAKPIAYRVELGCDPTRLVKISFGHGEHGRRGHLSLDEHRLEVVLHLVFGTRRDAVDHDRQRRSPVLRESEVLPRNRVGVTRCGRDEDPQVGRSEKLGREVVVRDFDRVDVGGVEQRQPR